MIDRIADLYRGCLEGSSHFPPTTLYNESWMLRLLLDWCSQHPENQLFPFMPEANWFAEGLLASAFLPRHRGDALAETHTHADGMIGHFALSDDKRAAIALMPAAQQLVVVEGKMFSPLSRGTKNAPEYDQAARSVACMAEILRLANRSPTGMSSLEFVLVAPQIKIEEGHFAKTMSRESIEQKVRQRVSSYEGEKDSWLAQWFAPTLDRIGLRTVSWEDALTSIGDLDAVFHSGLSDFYKKCLQWNMP